MRIAIIGAGPCGLACARELDRLGHDDWTLLEHAPVAGGSAGSIVDPKGFTWDFGGHVVFSHFGEFDALLDEVMGDELLEHDRSSYIRFGDRWIPYPFQNNLRHLPSEIAEECLAGLRRSPGASGSEADFGEWMEAVFGPGITRHFMRPYNEKVWATEVQRMSYDWIAERVSVPEKADALANFARGRDDREWGPNSTFKFPLRGGTGEIFRRVAAQLGKPVRLATEVVGVDPAKRLLHLSSGETESYDALVSTMPIDRLVKCARGCPSHVRAAAQTLVHTSVVVVGVGYEQPLDDSRSWLYFPDPSTPFYRATNFAKYAASNVPNGETSRFCSYMTETSYRSATRPALPDLEERVIESLRDAGLAAAEAPLASVHSTDLEYAYPVPTLDRDRALATIEDWLVKRGIHSRGRFGEWRYESGNMDHAVKSGIDAAHRLVEEPAKAIGS